MALDRHQPHRPGCPATAAQAEPSAPPTSEQAARILNEAWQDPDWSILIWLTMVTGFHRGELCAIRWRHLDLAAGVLMLERSIGQRSGRTWEKDTKTHQHRRIALDPETLSLLSEHRHRCDERAAALEPALTDDAFVFSLAVDGSLHLKPDSVSSGTSDLPALRAEYERWLTTLEEAAHNGAHCPLIRC